MPEKPVNVAISPTLHRKLKSFKKESGLPVRIVVERALVEFLERNKKAAA